MTTPSIVSLPVLAAIPWLRHAVTTRDAARPLGGDMSFSTGAACPAGILANRTYWLARIGRTPDQAAMSGLVHGTAIRSVDWHDAGSGVRAPETVIAATDGLMTATPGLALMMCFADCVPLIVVDTRQRVVCLAHAGWRGTLAGMANRVVTAMHEAYGSRPDDMLAVIGPSIGPHVYAVGPEVATAFRAAYPTENLIVAVRGSGFGVRAPMTDCGLSLEPRTDATHLDLWEANAAQLRSAGIAVECVHLTRICTFAYGDRFFSHRYAQRYGENEGRFAVLLSIEE